MSSIVRTQDEGLSFNLSLCRLVGSLLCIQLDNINKHDFHATGIDMINQQVCCPFVRYIVYHDLRLLGDFVTAGILKTISRAQES